MATASLLESIAAHEKELMADLSRTREESRGILDTAHSDSATLLQESNARLDSDIATLRRDAAVEREKVRTSIQNATADAIESIRRESASRTAQVRQELLARIVPGV